MLDENIIESKLWHCKIELAPDFHCFNKTSPLLSFEKNYSFLTNPNVYKYYLTLVALSKPLILDLLMNENTRFID
jgi:hypothetical protein